MSRPRKDSELADARSRMIEAFWTLLESNRLEKISVSMITSEAGCNRGTFYYHFAVLDDLFQQAIRAELFADGLLLHAMQNFLHGQAGDSPIDSPAKSAYSRRLLMTFEKGGTERATNAIKYAIIDAWSQILCSIGHEMKPETRTVISYAVSGVISLITDAYRFECETGERFDKSVDLGRFIQAQSHLLVDQISHYEDIEIEELCQAVASFDFEAFLKQGALGEPCRSSWRAVPAAG